MRRIMLLALVALALPTAALATSVGSGLCGNPALCFSSGTFLSGHITRDVGNVAHPGNGGLPPGNFVLDLVGSGGIFQILTHFLSPGCDVAGVGTCTISSGQFALFGTSLVFNFNDGVIHKTATSANISATLGPSLPSGFPAGFLRMTVSYSLPNPFVSEELTGGTGVFGAGSPVPEPSTLLTFGTGVLGLVGMMRRKLKLGT